MNAAGNDNSHFEEKVRLRLEAVERINATQVMVLDMFAGKGLLWKEVQKRTDKKIVTLSIEKERGKNKRALTGDNVKFLPSLNPGDFDIIDIDAYGIPARQILWAAKGKALVIVTAIISAYGITPYELCKYYGIEKSIYNEIKISIQKLAFDMIDGIFFDNGYAKKIGYNFGRKQYFYYICN